MILGAGSRSPSGILYSGTTFSPGTNNSFVLFGGTWAAQPVPYLYGNVSDKPIAFDIIPKGTIADDVLAAWHDIVDTDIVANGIGSFEAVSMGKYKNGYGYIGCTATGAGRVVRPLVLASFGGNVGVGIVVNPKAQLDMPNYFRVQGSDGITTGIPATGKGLEVTFDRTSNIGYVFSFDRDSSAFKPLNLDSSVLRLNSTSTGLTIIGGPSFNAGSTTQVGVLNALGQVIMGVNPRFNGTNTTGAGAALLGVNSPASTLSAPFTWFQVVTADGSTGYIPVWK